MRGLERLRWITARIRDLATEYDLAVIEGPSFGSKYGSPHERGGLWWMVRDVVDGAGIPVAVAPPSSVKLWATGSGGASKDAVKAAMRARYPHVRIRNSDEADALAMADLGAAWLADGPLSDIQQRAVKGVAWPEKEVTLR
jgi:crossover junction endodeoxyribonuclease RuvC